MHVLAVKKRTARREQCVGVATDLGHVVHGEDRVDAACPGAAYEVHYVRDIRRGDTAPWIAHGAGRAAMVDPHAHDVVAVRLHRGERRLDPRRVVEPGVEGRVIDNRLAARDHLRGKADVIVATQGEAHAGGTIVQLTEPTDHARRDAVLRQGGRRPDAPHREDRKSTRLNSSHGYISY